MSGLHLSKSKNVHFFGIGGIGVSGLARAFAAQGKIVSGQDLVASPVTDALIGEGIKVSIGQSVNAIPKQADLVVYSSALLERNPVFSKKLKELTVPTLSYSDALGLFSEGKYTVAVAGTHGKTTTTAMIAHILSHAGLKPTVIVGSLFKNSQSNFLAGESEYFVVEADDYRRQFLSLEPKILVITNIGKDHLDYYKDLADIQSAFAKLAAKVPKTGYIVANLSDPIVRAAISGALARVVDYRGFMKKKIELPVPGAHNQENAACALTAAHVLGVSSKKALKALAGFLGTWRRFDFRGKTKRGALVYDDYAHNPDKVRAAIAGFREAHPKHRLVVVFQPHLYSRTKTLLPEFSESFDDADEVIVVPIFAARELPDKKISSKILAERIQKHIKDSKLRAPLVSYSPDVKRLAQNLRKRISKGDVVVTMGAGDIYRIVDTLLS